MVSPVQATRKQPRMFWGGRTSVRPSVRNRRVQISGYKPSVLLLFSASPGLLLFCCHSRIVIITILNRFTRPRL